MAKSTVSDRLIFTLIISIIIHLILVLGISFDVFSTPTNAPINNLEITLVKQQDNTKPEEADFLAQADNEGGGETDTPSPEPTPDLPVPKTEDTPTAEPIAPVAAATIDPEPTPIIEPDPVPEPPAPEPVQAEPSKQEPPKPAPPEPEKPQPEKTVKKVTQQQAERKVQQVEDIGSEAEPEAEVAPQPRSQPSARDLMLQARNEISELQDKLDKTTKALSERPKKRRISAATKEYAAAAYMKAWEMKVERIGNMNYPQEARKQGINGTLMLSVDINPDGSVPPGGIVISRPSGYPVLDEAAIKIVRLGAPYAAIPDNVLKNNDMLTIIRTWKFETGRGLSTR
ncbi:energy transducer TonB [Methylophaga sp. OBS4]|uniref:energy transducer TonB n=1 Tax=Methylophaga sp. OBS4 TaxID=2991935 RepID=UPI0022550BD3|nr:energy transducer TonB [Methylophaga sp. OBS4]MCX4188138.1 TonB family protein [Methylophaga sp. OBS4]